MSIGVAEADNVFAIGKAIHKKVIPEDSVIACYAVVFVENFKTETAVIIKDKTAEEVDCFFSVYDFGVIVGLKPVTGMVDV